MAQYIQLGEERLPKLKSLTEALGWEQSRVARLAIGLGLRYNSHEAACSHDFGKSSATYLHDTQLDPEQNQLRVFKVLVEQREGRRLDQSEANDLLTRYLDLGIAKLHEAWIGRDQDKYKLFAFLRDLLASTPQSDPLAEFVSSAPDVLVGIDDKGHPVRFRPNQEGGHRNAAHFAIAGSTGVGKTQTALALLDQTLSLSPGSGCLILDYKGDITRQQGDFLDRLGFVRYAAVKQKLPVNPLYLPADAHAALSAQALAERLCDVQRLGQVQELAIREAATSLFENRSLFPPTLPALKEALLEVYERQQKAGKADTAVKLISDLADFSLFQDESGLDPVTFLGQRIIIDFAAAEAFRDMIAFFLLNYIVNGMKMLGDAPVQSESNGLRTRELRSVIFIDEAHHYLKANASPVYQIVREARSFGVALWLSTQSLADFQSEGDDLIANLSTWLLFAPGATAVTAKQLAGYLRLSKPDADHIAAQLPKIGNGECFANLDGVPRRLRAVQLWEKANWPSS